MSINVGAAVRHGAVLARRPVARVGAALATAAVIVAAGGLTGVVVVAGVGAAAAGLLFWRRLRPRLGALTAAVAVALCWGALCGVAGWLGARDMRSAAAFAVSGFMLVIVVTMLAMPAVGAVKGGRFAFSKLAARRRPDTGRQPAHREPAPTSRTTPKRRRP